MKKSYYIYFGVLQSFHIVFLVIFFINSNWVFSFLNNTAIWGKQLINMFYAISIVDFINAVISVILVYNFINNNTINKKLIIMVLSISIYSALIFGLAINFNQLQKGNELVLSLFSLPFMPVFYFLFLVLKKNKLSS